MTSDQLSAVAGIVLSLLFSYVPKLQEWYGPKDSVTKSLIMLGALVVTSVGAYALSCSGWWLFVVCGQEGIKTLIEAFVAAAIANQIAYSLSPETRTAKAMKASRSTFLG